MIAFTFIRKAIPSPQLTPTNIHLDKCLSDAEADYNRSEG